MESSEQGSAANPNEKSLIRELERDIDPNLFKGLNVNASKRKQILENVAYTALRIKQHKGPLPDPETLAEYDRAVPGAAKAIIDTFTEQSKHRREMEKKVIGRQTFQSGAGQLAAFLLGLGSLGGGVFLVMNDHDASGVSIVTIGMGALALAFLKSKNEQAQDLESKRPKS